MFGRRKFRQSEDMLNLYMLDFAYLYCYKLQTLRSRFQRLMHQMHHFQAITFSILTIRDIEPAKKIQTGYSFENWGHQMIEYLENFPVFLEYNFGKLQA